jgi:hypothetical protein
MSNKGNTVLQRQKEKKSIENYKRGDGTAEKLSKTER